MAVRVFDREPFGDGSGEEALICGDEGERNGCGFFQRCRELNRIVGTQRMPFDQILRALDQGVVGRGNEVVAQAMAIK